MPVGKNRERSNVAVRLAPALLAIVVVALLNACTGDPFEVPPVITGFTATPAQIDPSDTSMLSWSVTGATSLTLQPGSVNVTGKSSWTVRPGASTTYTLVARNAAGEDTAETVVTVGDLPDIVSFEVEVSDENPDGLVNPGVPITLTWEVDDADTITISGPSIAGTLAVDAVGSLVRTPLVTEATYTLRATNGAGPVERELVVTRSVPAFSVLLVGQSNAKGDANLSPTAARDFITALPGVEMLGNDYVWKSAYEPTGDCVGHVDVISADPFKCTSFAQNTVGVSPGVSLANGIAAATGGEVFLVPAAKNGSGLSAWAPTADRYDRGTLFGSAAYRAQRTGIDRGAPFNSTFAGGRYGLVVWYQGTSNTSSVSQTNAFFSGTNNVLSAFQTELGAPVIVVQLHARGGVDDEAAAARNLLVQRARETQRRMAEDAVTMDGSANTYARANRYVVVTHDLPTSDIRHLDEHGQRELGWRVSMAAREHLLDEAGIDGSGPQLVEVVKSSNTVVRVVFDRPITETSGTTLATAYSGYFAVFAGDAALAVSDIRRDPSNTSAVRITLSASTAADVDVRYMPPPRPASIPPGTSYPLRQDVVRSASCTIASPHTGLCLPAAAFGDAMTAVEAASVRSLLLFEDGDE